jgi:hypothetical protein
MEKFTQVVELLQKLGFDCYWGLLDDIYVIDCYEAITDQSLVLIYMIDYGWLYSNITYGA